MSRLTTNAPLTRLHGARPTRRAWAAAAAVALLGGAGVLTTPVGQASAQSGSRLCGYVWHQISTDDRVARVAEVPKGGANLTQCDWAMNSYDHVPNTEQLERALGHPVAEGQWRSPLLFDDTRETLAEYLSMTTDPCDQMRRSDNIFTMRQYMRGAHLDGTSWAQTVEAIGG